MNIEAFRNYCLSKPGVTEEVPFGPDTLVFKVMGKMFALCGIENFQSFNAKCDPIRAQELREHYSGIQPGYHMNKKHWNTILTDGSVSDELAYELVDHSYELVVHSLPAKTQRELEKLRKS